MSQLLDSPITASATSTASRSDLIDRARALQPLLAKNAPEGDKTRQTNPDSMAAIRESGVFNVWVPKRYGGVQADMRTQLEILAALAEGDAASSWIGSLHTGCTFTVSLFPDEAQDEVWAEGTAIGICGGLTPTGQATKVDGGYRLSGSWMWQSGSQFANWTLLASPVVVDGEMTTVVYALTETSKLTLKDTWFTLGMRGTGSNTLTADDVFVPDHRALPLLDSTGAMNPVSLSSHTDDALYRVPVGTLCATWMVGVPLGIARAALTTALEQLPKRSLSYTTYESQRESVSTQLAIATAASMIDEAYLLACRACTDADRVANGEVTELDMVTRARARQDTGRATLILRQAVELIVRTCGASSMADFNPLQRNFRDISTLSLHALNNADIQAENYGRALLGLEPSITIC